MVILRRGVFCVLLRVISVRAHVLCVSNVFVLCSCESVFAPSANGDFVACRGRAGTAGSVNLSPRLALLGFYSFVAWRRGVLQGGEGQASEWFGIN